MHLTAAATETNLINYFQFNDPTSTEYDRGSNGYNLAFSGSASRSTSAVPVGGGSVFTISNVNSSGAKTFTGTNCVIEFPASGTYPNGDLVVSALNISPDQNPNGGTPLSNLYWIVNNYGTNSTFSALTSIKFSNLGSFTNTGLVSDFKLFKRNSNAHGATWGTLIDAADALTSTDNNTLTFSTNNNITNFSQFTITNNAALPIELLDFKAVLSHQKVEISWQVADEKDVNHYIVERSFDGKTFELLSKQAKGIFQTIDRTPQYGVNYYRLKVVENDGRYSYAPIRSVDLEQKQKTAFKIYPNPTADVLNIQFNAERSQVVDFELINAIGQIVHAFRIDSKMGDNYLYLSTGFFPAGLYSLRIQQGNIVTVEKIVLK